MGHRRSTKVWESNQQSNQKRNVHEGCSSLQPDATNSHVQNLDYSSHHFIQHRLTAVPAKMLRLDRLGVI
jgi:hypothetical protein